MYGFRFTVYGLDFARSVKPPVNSEAKFFYIRELNEVNPYNYIYVELYHHSMAIKGFVHQSLVNDHFYISALN